MVFLNPVSANSSPSLSRQTSLNSVTYDLSCPHEVSLAMRSSSTTSVPLSAPAIQDHASQQSTGMQSSLFLKYRSRSDTKDFMTSTISPVSSAQSFSSGISQNVSDMDTRPNKSKAMLPRGRKMKRHSSKLSFGSMLDGMGELVQTKTGSGKGSSARSTSVQDNNAGGPSPSVIADIRKDLISAPFNFQHLTHTKPQQLPPMEKASEQELANEFHIIRASQAPRRELFGIKAEDLRAPLPTAPPTLSSATSLDLLPDVQDEYTEPMRSAPLPQHSCIGSALERVAPQQQPKTIRKARSVESFSQPFIKPRSPKTPGESPEKASPTNIPQRSSSRLAQGRPLESPRYPLESPVAPTFTIAERRGAPGSSFPSQSFPQQEIQSDMEQWPITCQAVATPDESTRQANTATTPGYTTDLEDVPEETESYFQYRAAGRVRAMSVSSELRHSQSFPVTASPSSRPCSRGSTKFSQGNRFSWVSGHEDGSESSSRFWRSRPRTSSLRSEDPFSCVGAAMESSWEDVIDYCYDHNAEADCDFDWDRASTAGAAEGDDGLCMPKRSLSIRRKPSERRLDNSTSSPQRPVTEHERPQIVVPDVMAVPELASKSATSVATSSTIPTPSDPRTTSNPFRFSATYEEYDTFDNVQPLPTGAIIAPPKPSFADEGLNDDLPSDSELSLYRHRFHEESSDNRYSGPESIRSRLSKCSSEESFNRPSTLKHQSSSSNDSCPDLVYSRRAARSPAGEAIAERSPTFQAIANSELHLPSISSDRPVVPRSRSSSESVRPSHLVQSAAVSSTRARSSGSSITAAPKRASSALGNETSAPALPSEAASVDEGTMDLWKIGRPRRTGRAVNLFPPRTSTSTGPVL
ncbi:MAG: hypothetical protein M1820_000113 [Bogoriella megaspora]|nr:MAG: hypothetical protein M1820_000113 [Bogoriella megaspora]